MRKKLLVLAFFVIFMFLGIMALKDSMPEPKNERVYTTNNWFTTVSAVHRLLVYVDIIATYSPGIFKI